MPPTTVRAMRLSLSKAIAVACLALPAFAGGIRPELVWRPPPAGGARDGDLITISLDRKGTATFEASVDLSQWAGKILRATILSRGQDVVAADHDWLGYKFMLHFRDAVAGVESWPGASAMVGTWGWTATSFRVDLRGRKPTNATLTLGLQDTGGEVSFDLRTLRFEEVKPLFAQDSDDTKCVYSPHVRNMARMRGCMSPSRPCVEDDLATLRDWGANLLRYQIVRDWHGRNNNQDVGEYLKWVDSKVTHLLNDVLPWANAAGIRVIVDLHVPPGGRAENGDMNMFYDERFANAFLSAWTNIATRCCNRFGIGGYDLINEPCQRQEALASCDYLTLQERAAMLVRQIDSTTPIIVESNDWDSPKEFKFLRALKLRDVIYQVHMYDPFHYTHQGVYAKDGEWKRVAYPSQGIDKAMLRRSLQPVRDFQKRHDAIIYVGEFSAIAWAEGADRYLGDCISLFEEYGWHWSYHAFREWDGWSVEHEATEGLQMRPSADNLRRRALLRGLRGELSPSMSDAEKHHSAEMNKTEASVDGVGQGDVRLLVLGNSIALHGVAPHFGWTNAWGMAASSADRGCKSDRHDW